MSSYGRAGRVSTGRSRTFNNRAAALNYARRSQSRRRAYSSRRGSTSLTTARMPAPKTEIKAIDTPFDSSPNPPFSEIGVAFVPPGDPAPTPGTVQILPINLMSAGAGFYQRVGRKINLLSAEVKMNIFLSTYSLAGAPTGYMTPGTLRCLLVYDNAPNGVQPILSTILLDQYQTSVGTSTSVHSGLNLNYRDRFTVLRDMRISVPAVNITATGPGAPFASVPVWGGVPVDQTSFRMFHHEFTKKLKGLETIFSRDDSPSTIASISTGALYLVFISDVPSTGAANQLFWTASGRARVRYVDP